jgi:preprotein translocase subunit SecA
MDGIKEESVGFLFNLEVQTEQAPPAAEPIQNWAGGGPLEQAAAAADAPTNGNGSGSGNGSGNGRSAAPLAKGLEPASRPAKLQYTAPAIDGDASGGAVTTGGPQTDLGDGVFDATGGEPARNAPCPCGSGRKYKRCHGDPSRRAKA